MTDDDADRQVLRSRCLDLYDEVIGIVGQDRFHHDPTTNYLHSYDASLEYGQPDLVVAPKNVEELRALVAAAYRCGVPLVMRGAGTGYSGGALCARGGMVVLTAGLDRVLATDFDGGYIRCEPGVILARVHQLADEAGWQYLPDPSSHQVCTIGGNIAENAGGPHALGGGPTSNYVSAVDLIRPDGSIITLDEQQVWDGDIDLRSVLVGSEGTLGVISAVTLRLVRRPESARVVLGTFADQHEAVGAVTGVFDAGLLPSAMDMLTGGFIPQRLDFVDPSLLFVGLQGRHEEVADQTAQLIRCIEANGGIPEVLDISQFLQRRAELVRDKVRRMVAASGCPRYYLFDAVAPRSKLSQLLSSIRQAARDYDLPVLNTFHAGDGNVHPTPFYDPARRDHQERLREFSTQILRTCSQMGGALSGEHGIGLEKRHLMGAFFPPEILSIMHRIKHAFDPENLSNPGKILPDGGPRDERSSGLDTPLGSAGSPPRRNLVDAWVEITCPSTTFADLEAALAGTAYELPYEPLGSNPDRSIIAAIDAGEPGLRETGPFRARDLVLGADLHGNASRPALRLGGTLAKDVAGYELRKLVYGGRGRFGRLSRICLRVVPRTSDSRMIRSEPQTLCEALDLCHSIHKADLPFAYLGVLVASDGTVAVTGRMELRGGLLDRHLKRLKGICADLHVDSTVSNRWHDPAMGSLTGGGGALTGQPGLPWQHSPRLKMLAEKKIAGFSSIGHCRIWWRGVADLPRAHPPLTDALVAAFKDPT
jgi:glycolate oxidase